ncbi:MAG: hydroxymethylglutaryl-CoA lyase [Acidimicrobiales bacterium]
MSLPAPGAATMGLPEWVAVREVGPRDGLQLEAPQEVGERVALIEALVASGVAEIEAAAFVSPRVVPAMAAAAAVLAGVARRPGVRYWALVPNLRGADEALAAGADGLSVTLSASEAYSVKNVGRTVAAAVDECGRIAARTDGLVPVDAVISCSFGSPYEGEITPSAVAALARQAVESGATKLTLADTTGMATPRRIREVLAATGTDVGLHLHDSRGTALVNAYAALELGVHRFDTAVGGLGGSPFAPGAGGNLATEDLVYLLDDLGVATGIDLASVLAAGANLARILGHPLASRVAAAGPQARTGHESGRHDDAVV